jgi:hypothetical protein
MEEAEDHLPRFTHFQQQSMQMSGFKGGVDGYRRKTKGLNIIVRD